MPQFMYDVKSIVQSILTWNWTKRLLYWVVISAGTISEGVFLASSLWITLNASVHSLMRVFLSEILTQHLTELATASFVGLPECILALAICTTWGHIRIYRYDRTAYGSLFWAIVYGMPTAIFMILSVITIGCSMLRVGFILPDWAVVIRGLSGYAYGITAILYWKLGHQQEVDRLKEKDDLYAMLEQQGKMALKERDDVIATLYADIARIQQDMYATYKEKEAIIEEKEAIIEEKEAIIHEKELQHSTLVLSPELALQAHGDNIVLWLSTLDKTVDIEDIVKHTGIHRRKLQGAIERKELHIKGSNKSRVSVSSLREYLINTIPSSKPVSKEMVSGPMLRIVNGDSENSL